MMVAPALLAKLSLEQPGLQAVGVVSVVAESDDADRYWCWR